MPVVCLANPLQFDQLHPSPMSSVPLPEAAQLQKPQDYKETFKVSLCAHLRMENVFDKNPQKRTVVSEYADPCKLAASESFKCLER